MTSPALPHITGLRLINALQKGGFVKRRQKGSHAVMVHNTDLSRRTIVPVHGSKTIKLGTLCSILKGTKLTAEELRKLM